VKRNSAALWLEPRRALCFGASFSLRSVFWTTAAGRTTASSLAATIVASGAFGSIGDSAKALSGRASAIPRMAVEVIRNMDDSS
jgi:hypothetical protein